MGQAQANPKEASAEADDDFWYALVEQVSPYLPSDKVLRWDKEKVQQIVLDISDVDTEKYWDFRAASMVKLSDEKRAPLPEQFAVKMLALDSRLGKLRLKMVPGRIKETEFWKQYFEQIVIRISDHVHGNRASAESDGDATQ